MPQTRPAAAIAQALLALPAFSAKTVRVGKVHEDEQELIQCIPSGGFAPEPEIGGPTACVFRDVFVQVLIRSAPQRYGSGYELAWDVYNALDRLDLTAQDTDYIGVLPVLSGPLDLQQDEQDRYLFSINVQVMLAHDPIA